MNERNVEALKTVMRSLPLTPLAEHEIGMWIPQLATELAARGVLVPSALTDDDLIAMTTVNWKEIGADFPAWLERIAKGEPRSPQEER